MTDLPPSPMQVTATMPNQDRLAALDWIYYSVQIFLLGAEFTKVYATTHGSKADDPVTATRAADPVAATTTSDPTIARLQEELRSNTR